MSRSKLISLLLALFMLVSVLSACESDSSNKKSTGELQLDNIFGDRSENSGEPMDSYPEYHIMDYLKDTYEKPVILYVTRSPELSKTTEIWCFYILKDGKCRKYTDVAESYYDSSEYDGITLGELSKMSDDEIITMLEESYEDGYRKAFDVWYSVYYESRDEEDRPYYFSLEDEFRNGTAKVYRSDYLDFTSYLLTDDSGNRVEKEVLVFPVAGIGDDPYVMYYPEYDESEHEFMNYYGTDYDEDSYRTTKLDCVYFNTGWGNKHDINCINDYYCISQDSAITAGVYNSIYYGYNALESDWTYGETTIFFRHENAYVLDMKLDNLSSEHVCYIDPTTNELLSLSRKYYNIYYNSFENGGDNS